MTSTTTDEYEHDKQRRYYIHRQTKSKNDVKAESQPIPDVMVRRAQKFIPKKEKIKYDANRRYEMCKAK